MSQQNDNKDALKSELEGSAYTEHLSAVNQSRAVVASQDIYNARGILLVRKGAALDKKAANKIIQYKLLKPLEESISIENTLDGRQLYEAIETTVSADPVLKYFHESLNLQDELKELCLLYNTYPILVQKITVLSIQMPIVFIAGVVSASIGFVLAHHLGLDNDAKRVVFLAGLSQNVGMLHIDSEMVQKKGSYTVEQRRALQVHPIIGEKVLSSIEKLPDGVATAVLEHHECADGSGYPKGVWGDQLSIESQIIAFVDSLFAIYKSTLLKKGYTFKEIIPIMQWSNSAHFYQVYEVAVQLMRAQHVPDTRHYQDEDIPHLIDQLIVDDRHLAERYTQKKSLLDALPPHTPYRKLNTSIAIHDRIHNAVSSTGLTSAEYEGWLQDVKDNQITEEYMEVERAALVHSEFRYQLQLLDNNLRATIDESPSIDGNIKSIINEWLQHGEAYDQAISAA